MRLNKCGIYRIVGESFEILANVIGEPPTLRITGALDLNTLVEKGEFKVLSEESLQIQQIYADPSKFLFLPQEFSEVCNTPPYRQSIRGVKVPEVKDKEYEDFKARYIQDTQIIGRGVTATKAYIMEKTDWSLAQINVLILKLASEVAREQKAESMRNRINLQ